LGVGLLLGAVVGAGVALLLAPCSGEETRSRIADTARRLGKGAQDKVGQVKDVVGDLTSSTRSAFEAGREAFVQDGANRENRFQRTTQPSAAMPSTTE
jgi:gas vesicle protein